MEFEFGPNNQSDTGLESYSTFHEQLGEFVLGSQIPLLEPQESLEIPSNPSLRGIKKKIELFKDKQWIQVNDDDKLPCFGQIPYMQKMPYSSTFAQAAKPHEIFSYYFDDAIFSHIKEETNKYADFQVNTTKGKDYLKQYPNSRNKNWTPLESDTDIRFYIASLIYMGICKLPTIEGIPYLNDSQL